MKKKNILIEKYIEPDDIHAINVAGFDYIVKSWHNKFGETHSFFDHPASIWYDNRNGETTLYWYEKDIKHRKNNLPSEVKYDKKGKIIYEVWYNKGKYVEIFGDSNECSSYESTIKYFENNEEELDFSDNFDDFDLSDLED